MLIPHPESNLNLNIMVLGSEIIAELKSSKEPLTLDALMDHFIKIDKKRTPEMLMETLIFLYSFGLVKSTGFKLSFNS